MARLVSAALAAGLSVAPAWGASLRGDPEGLSTQRQMIPGTDVPMPDDYEDYTRGRQPWAVFPEGRLPGYRQAMPSPGRGLPAFKPSRPEESREAFIDASPLDPVGHMCAPGGDAAGHYFYNVWTPELVPYVVAQDDPRRRDAAVVVAPGGGSIHLAWEPEGIAAAEWLNSLGISAFVLKYRVPDKESRVQTMDMQRAVSLVRQKAPELGLNASRIGVMGSSAGGQLALAAASRERQYDRIDEVDDADYRPNFLLLLYSGIPMDILFGDELRTLPPVFLAFAEDDPCCKAFLTHWLAERLKKDGPGNFVQVRYKEGRHGWGSCEYYPKLKGLEVCTWRSKAEPFLDSVLAA